MGEREIDLVETLHVYASGFYWVCLVLGLKYRCKRERAREKEGEKGRERDSPAAVLLSSV